MNGGSPHRWPSGAKSSGGAPTLTSRASRSCRVHPSAPSGSTPMARSWMRRTPSGWRPGQWLLDEQLEPGVEGHTIGERLRGRGGHGGGVGVAQRARPSQPIGAVELGQGAEAWPSARGRPRARSRKAPRRLVDGRIGRPRGARAPRPLALPGRIAVDRWGGDRAGPGPGPPGRDLEGGRRRRRAHQPEGAGGCASVGSTVSRGSRAAGPRAWRHAAG